MKKRILSIILTLVLIIGAAPIVFAEETAPETEKIELTSEQKADREAFLKVYNEQKAKLDSLRIEAKNLIEENNSLSKQIKTILQEKYKNKAEEVKTNGEKVRELARATRDLNKQLIALRAKAKGKNVDTSSITLTIPDIIEKIKKNKADIISLNNGHKENKEELKALKDSVQDLITQEKEIRQQIEKLREKKAAYFTSFKADLESLNYDQAAKDYTNIVETKAKIVEQLKVRQTILNQILEKIK